VRKDETLMSPTREGAGDLHIFEKVRRFVFCVFGDPAQSNDSKNLLLDDGAGADATTFRVADEFTICPGLAPIGSE